MAEAFVNVTEGSGKKLHGWDRVIGANTVIDEFMLPGEYPVASYTFAATGVSIATVNDHLLQIMAGASLNVRIRRIDAWQAGLAGAVSTVALQLLRLTTAGTGGTALTAAKLDTADAAAGATGMTIPTVKGTESTILRTVRMGIVAAQPTNPNGLPLEVWDQIPNSKPVVIPAGAANGIAVKVVGNVAGATMDIYAEIVETSFV